jgi:hypothetical protein
VDLEEADIRLRFEDAAKMLGLEAQPAAGRQAGGPGAATPPAGDAGWTSFGIMAGAPRRC